MKKILINYLIVVLGLMAVVTLGLGLPVSAALRSIVYLSVPTLVLLGIVYVVIEHGISIIQKSNHNNLIEMPMQNNVELAKSA